METNDTTKSIHFSDAVKIAALTSVAPTLTGIAAIIVAIYSVHKVENVRAEIVPKVAEVQANVLKIEKATNSMKDALVAVTRSDALQEGHAEGVKDQKAAAKSGNK